MPSSWESFSEEIRPLTLVDGPPRGPASGRRIGRTLATLAPLAVAVAAALLT